MATLSDVVELARIFADQDSSDFPTAEQYNKIVASAGRLVYNDLFKANYPFDFQSVNILSSGATTYSPVELQGAMAIRGVWYLQSGDRFEVDRIKEGLRAQLLSVTSVSGYAEYYDIRVSMANGLVVELLPPSTGITYVVDYIPGFSLDNDDAVLNGPNGMLDAVALRSAVIAIRKEGSARAEDAKAKMEEYQEVLQGITDLATYVDLRNPATIRNIKSLHTRFAFDYPVSGFDGAID